MLASLRSPGKNPAVAVPVGGGSGGGGGGGELQNTRTLPLVNGGSTVRKKAEAKNLPTPGAMASQEDANLYFLECLNRDSVHVGVAAPDPPYTAGQLWFSTEDTELTLFIYDGNDWVVASPPVSLDGIESSITGIEGDLIELHNNVRQVKGDIVLTNQDLQALAQDQNRQDERLDALESADSGGDYLPTAGGELKGTLQINGTQNSKIDPLLCRADGYYMSFGVSKNGDVFAGASISNPFLATENWHVVTKGYLDQAMPVVGPAKYAWKHRTISSKEPADGYMNFNQINWAQRHEKMYFSPTPAIGPKFKLPKSKLIVDHHGTSSSTDSPLCSVWKAPKSDGTWELQGSFRIERIETDSNGNLVVTVGQDGWGSCGAEHEIVYFTIGGLF